MSSKSFFGVTRAYAKITTQKLGNDLTAFGNQLNLTFGNIKVAGI